MIFFEKPIDYLLLGTADVSLHYGLVEVITGWIRAYMTYLNIRIWRILSASYAWHPFAGHTIIPIWPFDVCVAQKKLLQVSKDFWSCLCLYVVYRAMLSLYLTFQQVRTSCQSRRELQPQHLAASKQGDPLWEEGKKDQRKKRRRKIGQLIIIRLMT